MVRHSGMLRRYALAPISNPTIKVKKIATLVRRIRLVERPTALPGSGGLRFLVSMGYMLIWTTILEGREGLGEAFDFVHFVGPLDFARYFGFDGSADMLKVEQYFDKRLNLHSAVSAPTICVLDAGPAQVAELLAWTVGGGRYREQLKYLRLDWC